MPDLISLPCEILFCFVFNRTFPVLDTGTSRDKKEGQVLSLELVKDQPGSVFRSDGLRILVLPLTSDTGSDATNGLRILVFDSRLPTVFPRVLVFNVGRKTRRY
jgi:hypothetical protein